MSRLFENLGRLRDACAAPTSHDPADLARGLLWLARIDGLDVPPEGEALPALLAGEPTGCRTVTTRESVAARLALGLATTLPAFPAVADVWAATELCDRIGEHLTDDGGAA